MEYSIDGGTTYQASNEFLNLGSGTYNFQVRIQGTNCIQLYTQNQITLNEICCQSSEDIVYVRHDATGNNDGTSWEHAFTDLQPAINSACAAIQIWVAAGTYQPTEIPYDSHDFSARLRTFHLSQDVLIYGGFAGTETQLDQRNPATNPTILDANGGYHTIIAIDLSNQAIIDGFTIQGANGNAGFANTYAGGGFFHSNAGGVFLRSSDVQIRNCIITNNRSDAGSGVMIQSASNPTIINCLFFDNPSGSAIYTFQGSKPQICLLYTSPSPRDS